jgi:hypothetical protein
MSFLVCEKPRKLNHCVQELLNCLHAFSVRLLPYSYTEVVLAPSHLNLAYGVTLSYFIKFLLAS